MPIVGLNVLGVLSLAVDTMMCGRLPDAERALTALGFAGQVIFLLMVAMMGLTVGAVALVARAHGSRDGERVDHLIQQASLLTLVVSILVALVGNALSGTLIDWLGASPDTRDVAIDYLRPLLTFAVFYYLNILYAGVLRGVGNTTLPFLVAVAYNALNVILNYGLIFGELGMPELGVVGAAWGTVISQAFGALLTIGLLFAGSVDEVKRPVAFVRLDRALSRELFRVGFPAALDMVVLNIAFLSVVAMLGWGGEIAVAAHGVGLRIQSLALVPGLGVAQAIGAMVGNALGAGRVEDAREITRAGMGLACGIMGVIGLAIIVSAEWTITALFNIPRGSELAEHSLTWMRLLGLGMPIVGLHLSIVGMLRGAGATNTSLGINALATLGFQVPLSYLLGFVLGWGPFGIWLAMTPLSFAARLLLDWAAYAEGSWAKLGARVGR